MKGITTYFKSLIQTRKPNPFPQSKHVIKEAFDVGGVQYYEFDTLANLPFKRGLKFFSVFNELDMRCDRFYLEKHVEAMKNILNGKSIGLKQLSSLLALNNQMEERLKYIYDEDLVYKVASVVFFDAHENPDDWEWKYAMKKIEHWKKHEGVGDFFLHEPIQRLMPFLNAPGMSLEHYSEVVKELDKAQLANIYTNLSEEQKESFAQHTQRYFWREMKQGSMN